MVPLSQIALAMAGAFTLCASPTAGIASAVDVAVSDLSLSRGNRYDPALVRSGSSDEAVNICIQATQKDMEVMGRIMGIDVQAVERLKGGYDVHGSVLIESSGPKGFATADFDCVTKGNVVTKLTISRWRTDAA